MGVDDRVPPLVGTPQLTRKCQSLYSGEYSGASSKVDQLLPKSYQTHYALAIPPWNSQRYAPRAYLGPPRVKGIQTFNVVNSETVGNYDNSIHTGQHPFPFPSSENIDPGGQESSLVPDVLLTLYYGTPELSISARRYYLVHINIPNIVFVHLLLYILQQ